MKRTHEHLWSGHGGRRQAREERQRRLREHTALFLDPQVCLHAVKVFREKGYEIKDVYTPFPVHGMDEAMGIKSTGLGWATLCGGAIGCVGAVLMQSWIHAVDWPLNIGGKSFLALPTQIVVAFEMTILLAAFATVGGLFWKGRLFPRLFGAEGAHQPHPRVTDDGFVILIEEKDGQFNGPEFRALCAELGATEVAEGWRMP